MFHLRDVKLEQISNLKNQLGTCEVAKRVKIERRVNLLELNFSLKNNDSC